MHLYDKNGFKTTLGLILEKFIEYVSKPKYENSYYSIFDMRIIIVWLFMIGE